MEYDEAFWLLVDVINLGRGVGQAQAALHGTKEKVAKAKEHLESAKAAETQAKADLEMAKQTYADAQAKVDEIPAELRESAYADVDARNQVRDAVVKAMAGVATGSGKVN